MQIPTYHVWEIEQKAVEFHAACCSTPILVPVNIELIIEKRLGFDILPVDNLKREHDIYGCLIRDLTTNTMIVAVDEYDEYMVENNETTVSFHPGRRSCPPYPARRRFPASHKREGVERHLQFHSTSLVLADGAKREVPGWRTPDAEGAA